MCTRFSPRHKTFLDGHASRYGDSLFSKVRANKELEPLGCIGYLFVVAYNQRLSHACYIYITKGAMGWYQIRLSLWTFEWRLPHKVSCTFNRQTEVRVHPPSHPHAPLRSNNRRKTTNQSTTCKEGVPTDASVLMRWDHLPGALASFDISFYETRRQACSRHRVANSTSTALNSRIITNPLNSNLIAIAGLRVPR